MSNPKPASRIVRMGVRLDNFILKIFHTVHPRIMRAHRHCYTNALLACALTLSRLKISSLYAFLVQLRHERKNWIKTEASFCSNSPLFYQQTLHRSSKQE